MKIIALEEHTVSKAIETANHDAITASFPYYAAFNHPVPSYHLSLPDLFELGERRVKELDAAGIDMDYCVKKMGIDHLLFATDFPYIPLAGAKPFVDNAHLYEGDKEKFAHINAEKLLHLKD